MRLTEALGYALVVAIAFLLGVAVTLFCVRLRKWRGREDDTDDRDR